MDIASQQFSAGLAALRQAEDRLRSFGYSLYLETKARSWTQPRGLTFCGKGHAPSVPAVIIGFAIHRDVHAVTSLPTRIEADVLLWVKGNEVRLFAATIGLPETEAVRRFVSDLINGISIVVLWSVRGELRDMWVSADAARDAAYPQFGESVELRYWDGRSWSTE